MRMSRSNPQKKSRPIIALSYAPRLFGQTACGELTMACMIASEIGGSNAGWRFSWQASQIGFITLYFAELRRGIEIRRRPSARGLRIGSHKLTNCSLYHGVP